MRLLSLLSIVGLVACSGAAATELDGPATNESASTPSVSSTEPTKGADDQPGATGDRDPTKPSVADPGEPGAPEERGDPDEQDCVSEVEGNNNFSKATKFEGCIAGSLSNDRDEDYVTFIAPTDAKRMTISHQETERRVVFNVFTKAPFTGMPIPAGALGDDSIKVVAGATYFVKMSAPMWDHGDDENNDKAERGWELRVEFE